MLYLTYNPNCTNPSHGSFLLETLTEGSYGSSASCWRRKPGCRDVSGVILVSILHEHGEDSIHIYRGINAHKLQLRGVFITVHSRNSVIALMVMTVMRVMKIVMMATCFVVYAIANEKVFAWKRCKLLSSCQPLQSPCLHSAAHSMWMQCSNCCNRSGKSRSL